LTFDGLPDRTFRVVLALRRAVREAEPDAEGTLAWGALSDHRPAVGASSRRRFVKSLSPFGFQCTAILSAANAHAIDKPIAALLGDLKRRGLLKDTLVVWGGEFGRTPGAQGNDGRDHNAKGFSMWMAGGGVKGGHHYGATDEHGIAAVKDPMHINDMHATMLYLLGLDHERLTYRYSGRDFRLTDLAGVVAKGVVA
jgi:hypothetical protein